MHKQKDILLCISLFAIVLSYKNRCPTFLEWSMLSKQCSNEEPFHCLLDDDSKSFIQRCRKWEWVTLGSFPVLSGRYIYYQDCSPNTYQPFIYKSTENYKCQFNTSLCKELGNVIIDNGTTVTNRLCGCDQTKGYAFVVEPTTGSCNSVLEDCSCYLQQCDLGQLDQDYNCRRDETEDPSVMETSTIYRPLVDINEEIRSTNIKPQFYILNENEKYTLTALIMIILVLLSANISVIVLCRLTDTNEETNSAKQLVNTNTKDKQDLLPVQSQSTNQDILEDEQFTKDRPGSTVPIATKSVSEEITIDKPYINTIKDQQERTETIIPQFVRDEMPKNKPYINTIKDQQERTETIIPQFVRDEMPKNSADILILELEYPPEKENVIIFRDHIRSLAAELGYNDIQVKIFEEIIDVALSKKQIMLPELFARCKYLFVYISKRHLSSKALGKGLCEKDLVDYMSRSSANRNLKTVFDCESWIYPDYRTDFNYFEYKQSKDCETYKSSLLSLLRTLRR